MSHHINTINDNGGIIIMTVKNPNLISSPSSSDIGKSLDARNIASFSQITGSMLPASCIDNGIHVESENAQHIRSEIPLSPSSSTTLLNTQLSSIPLENEGVLNVANASQLNQSSTSPLDLCVSSDNCNNTTVGITGSDSGNTKVHPTPKSRSPSPNHAVHVNSSNNDAYKCLTQLNGGISKPALPLDLRRILNEVSQTGKCSSLSWSLSSSSNILHSRNSEKSNKRKRRLQRHRKDTFGRVSGISKRQQGGCHQSSNGVKYHDFQKQDNFLPRKNPDIKLQSKRYFDTPHDNIITDSDCCLLPSGRHSNEEKTAAAENPATENEAHQKQNQNDLINRKQQDISVNISDTLNFELEHDKKHNSSEIYDCTHRNKSDKINRGTSCGESVSSASCEDSAASEPSFSPSSNLRIGIPTPYRTLKDALIQAVVLALENAYMNHGGYKLNTAEKRRFQTLNTNKISLNGANGLSKSHSVMGICSSEAESAFRERRKLLLSMLGGRNTHTHRGQSPVLNNASSSGPQSSSPGNVSDITTENEEAVAGNYSRLLKHNSQTGYISPSLSLKDFIHSNISMTGEGGHASDASLESNGKIKQRKGFSAFPSNNGVDIDCGYGPPFTIQRVAEVLLNPERYYSQTHKLCNALEKLLLVSSPSSAFGGVSGGETLQSRKEEQEIAALADERGRQKTEQRQRRIKRRMSDDGDPVLQMNVNVDTNDNKRIICNGVEVSSVGRHDIDHLDSSSLEPAEDPSCESNRDHDLRLLTPNPLSAGNNSIMLDIDIDGEHDQISGTDFDLERASNDKFVSMPIDNSVINEFSHLSGNNCRLISTPSSGLVRNNDSGIEDHDLPLSRVHLSGEVGRQLQEQDIRVSSSAILAHHQAIVRPPSPIHFSANSGLNTIVAEHEKATHELQAHHAAALANVNELGSAVNVEMDIVIDPIAIAAEEVAATVGSEVSSDVADPYGDQGRSSASNSDVDSESGDDFSLDDSASDRSDGSDSGSGTGYYEPFTAARVMALNRMQQHHRREQYLQNRSLVQLSASETNFQPPPDSEYQSGDSIDSMMAEDSGGSDSSLDFAD